MKTIKNLSKYVLTSVLSVGLMVGLLKFDVISLYEEKETPQVTPSPVAVENGIQDIAEKVIPSVVTIQTERGEGSGIIMDEDGHIMTNAHVTDQSEALKVVTHDGQTYDAKLIGEDPQTDLALLKISAKNLEPAVFGSSEGLRVADQVLAVGNPGGLKFSSTVTVGHVSALNRQVQVGNMSLNFIQTDTAINPGNSGGALVNTVGEVIGVNTSKIMKEGYEGMGFSIPIDFALEIIEDIKAHGYVKDRATIGISAEFISPEEAAMYSIESGIYVHEVLSKEAKKVLQEKDILVSFEDEAIESMSHLSGILNKHKAGNKVKLKVYRDHELIDVTLTLSNQG